MLPTGQIIKNLKATLQNLKEQGIKLTHVLWYQGESNNGSSPEAYKSNLSKVVATIWNGGQAVKFYVAIDTYSPRSNRSASGIDTALQRAQKEFVFDHPGTVLGPDTDAFIGAIDRYDGWHLSEVGKSRVANSWAQVLLRQK